MKIRIIEKSNQPMCRIYFDVNQTAMLDDLTDIGLSEAQRLFVHTNVFDRSYPGTYTSLYYIRGSFKIPNAIPKSLGRVNQENLPYEICLVEDEDRIGIVPQNEMSLQQYLPVTPKASVTSMGLYSTDRREILIVHRDLKNQRRMVQYVFHPEAMDLLLKRIDVLSKTGREFLVTNQKLRDLWELA